MHWSHGKTSDLKNPRRPAIVQNRPDPDTNAVTLANPARLPAEAIPWRRSTSSHPPVFPILHVPWSISGKSIREHISGNRDRQDEAGATEPRFFSSHLPNRERRTALYLASNLSGTLDGQWS